MSRSGETMNSTTYRLIYPDSRTTFSTNSLLALRELGTVFIWEEINRGQPNELNELYCFRNFELRPLEISNLLIGPRKQLLALCESKDWLLLSDGHFSGQFSSSFKMSFP